MNANSQGQCHPAAATKKGISIEVPVLGLLQTISMVNASHPSKADKRADSTDSGLSSSHDKDNLVDLSQSLENLLINISKDGLTKASAMSASDKVIIVGI